MSDVAAEVIASPTTTTTARRHHSGPYHRPILAERFKTKMCANFVETGACPYFFRCMFAHGEHEMRDKHMNMAAGLYTEDAIKAFKKAAHASYLAAEAAARAAAKAARKGALPSGGPRSADALCAEASSGGKKNMPPTGAPPGSTTSTPDWLAAASTAASPEGPTPSGGMAAMARPLGPSARQPPQLSMALTPVAAIASDGKPVSGTIRLAPTASAHAQLSQTLCSGAAALPAAEPNSCATNPWSLRPTTNDGNAASNNNRTTTSPANSCFTLHLLPSAFCQEDDARRSPDAALSSSHPNASIRRRRHDPYAQRSTWRPLSTSPAPNASDPVAFVF